MLTSTINSAYTKDVQNVYYIGNPVPGADVATFQVLATQSSPVPWARDKNRIYCGASDGQTDVLENADHATFAPVDDSGYATDTTSVYAGCDEVIPGADPKTFVALDPYDMDGGYAKDANHVWWVVAPGAGLGSSWDFSAAPISGADPATFVLDESNPGQFDAKDKNHGYLGGALVN